MTTWNRLTPFGVLARPAAGSLEAWFAELAEAAARAFDLGPEQTALAWEVSSWAPDLSDADRRALMALVLATLVARSRGSTRLPLSAVPEIVQALAPGSSEWQKGIEELLRSGRASSVIGGVADDRCALQREGEFLYHQKLLRAERSVAQALAKRLAASPAPVFNVEEIDAAIAHVVAEPSIVGGRKVELSEEQRAAVKLALSTGLAVVSGGPGTGKTSVVVSILRAAAQLGVKPEEIALAAPTGKAAQRLGESIGEGWTAPVTIHRLLGTSADGSRVRHDEGNPLEHRLVIVDEASMIDLHLVERLTRAVRPEARLVLLGDARQLPSVGAGAVLRDLIPESVDHPLARNAVRLTKNFRVAKGAELLGLARWVSPEDAAPAATALEDVLTPRAKVDDVKWDGAEGLFGSGARYLRTFLERWYHERIANLDKFDELVGRTWKLKNGSLAPEELSALEKLARHFEAARILCLTRVYRTGSETLNEALRTFHRARRQSPAHYEFGSGEPVLALANDYEKQVFNGDQGLTLWVAEEGQKARLAVAFRRSSGFAIFPLELLRGRVERAFAMTVHKSQGSEFDHVALVLPDEDVPLLTREIVYTGVTRSRKSVLVVGDRKLLEAGARRTIDRWSGVGERLARPGSINAAGG